MQHFKKGRLLALACLLFLVECEVAILLLLDQAYAALLLHAAVTCALAVWAFSDPFAQGNRLAFLLVLLVALTGPFGALCSALAFAAHGIQAQTAPSPAEWIDAFLAEEDMGDTDYRSMMHALEDVSCEGVEPFQDILHHGTVRQKQMAIARITRHFRPSFGPMLVAASRDGNAAVRVQAATAMATIERRFMSQYIALEKAVERSADESARLKLAALYDDYAYTDILDARSSALLREKAIALYEAHPECRKNTALTLRLARLYLRHDHPEKARALLRPLAEGEAPAADVLSWYAEALFSLRRFGEVRQLALRHGKLSAPKEKEDVRSSTSPLPSLAFVKERYEAA